uniref:Serpentine receptor class gamma n=1 Tax=Rhabditophanes sp. KR3021 TaxID=114890 RepID=A0AC35TLM6_9BILA
MQGKFKMYHLINKNTHLVVLVYYVILVSADILSTLFYTALLTFIIKELLIKESTVTKEFYCLFVMTGLLDLIFIFEEYFSFRCAQMGLFESFYMNFMITSPLARYCITYSLAQLMLTAFFGIIASLNRMSSVYWPMKYLITYFAYVVPFEATYNLDVEDNIMSVQWAWFVLMTAHIATLILVAVLNFLLVRKLKKVFKVKSSQSKISKAEINLAKYCQINFLVILIGVIIELMLCLSNELAWVNTYKYCMTAYMLIESLTVFFPPYTLLIISSDVRNKFFVFIGVKKNFAIMTQLTSTKVKAFPTVI